PTDWWCARFNTVVFIGGVAAAYRLLRAHMDGALLTRFLLLLIGASMFPHHLEGYFAEVFTAVLGALGLPARVARSPLRGWTPALVGVVTTPAAIAGLAAAALRHVWETRRLRYLLPVAVAAAGIAFESWLRRGSPFDSGYAGNRGAITALPYS